MAQGIGAVPERSAYGEEGSFQSATFMDYLRPTAGDVPRIEMGHLETVPLDADVNFRGVGEGGVIVTPPTVVNGLRTCCHCSASGSTSSSCHRLASWNSFPQQVQTPRLVSEIQQLSRADCGSTAQAWHLRPAARRLRWISWVRRCVLSG